MQKLLVDDAYACFDRSCSIRYNFTSKFDRHIEEPSCQLGDAIRDELHTLDDAASHDGPLVLPLRAVAKHGLISTG